MVGMMIHETDMMIEEQTVFLQDIITTDHDHLTIHQTTQDHTIAGPFQDLQNAEITEERHQGNRILHENQITMIETPPKIMEETLVVNLLEMSFWKESTLI